MADIAHSSNGAIAEPRATTTERSKGKLSKKRPMSPPASSSRWTRKHSDKSDANGRPPQILLNSSATSLTKGISNGHANGSVTQANRDLRPGTGDGEFKISTVIPESNNLLDLESFDQLSFSKRGSILLGGKRGVHQRRGSRHLTSNGSQSSVSRSPNPSPSQQSARNDHRNISPEDEAVSNRIRMMYEYGDSDGSNLTSHRLSLVPDAPTPPDSSHSAAITENSDFGTPSDAMQKLNGGPSDRDPRSPSALSTVSNIRTLRRQSMIVREADELAGGIEDWAALDSADVDRYGFISPLRKVSIAVSLTPNEVTPPRGHLTPEPSPSPKRVSTILEAAANSPRKARDGPKRLSRLRDERFPSRKASTRSLQAPSSILSNSSTHSRQRSAAHLPLPHSKEKRTLAEASDMLTLPPGLAEEAAKADNGVSFAALKAKEVSRADKWRKMARSVHKPAPARRGSNAVGGGGGGGGGTEFDFDPSQPKVIERTWKGIPDCWRSSAWWAFLRRSAERRQLQLQRQQKPSSTDSAPAQPPDLSATALTQLFFTLIDQPCADDEQIDRDVPRTVAGHVMFRRRYRGGQRLLFRVLHCLSLAFPHVGYGQGMAGVAATLLCYYEEERAFVMAVWLWECRGVSALYGPEFGGLMEALERFEHWAGKGVVMKKLTAMDILPTTYGARWYLTLFNYSVPFAAQLRIWDIFMLYDCSSPSPSSSPTKDATLDVLHAVSAALLDGLAEVLADADFETAMKALTSFVPVQDEELLMRVVRVEWRRMGAVRGKKGGAGSGGAGGGKDAAALRKEK